MARYIHPSVRDVDETEESSITLVVIPKEGADDRVQNELRDLPTTVEEKSLGMLKVTAHSDIVSDIVKIEGIRSISPADTKMEDLSSGNLQHPQM